MRSLMALYILKILSRIDDSIHEDYDMYMIFSFCENAICNTFLNDQSQGFFHFCGTVASTTSTLPALPRPVILRFRLCTNFKLTHMSS